MNIRANRNWLLAAVLCLGSVIASAHPGHEFHVEGTVSKVRSQQFEVDEGERGKTVFEVIPGTEIFLNDARARVSDIVVGRFAEVDGVENDRGLIEAKKVKLKR